jgi:CheY-like chemotaxis protein
MARILVVDDSRAALTVTETILAEAGHQVTTSNSAKGAVKILQTQEVDVVLTDIYMPDEDGLELLKNIRRIAPDTPVIAMSGMTGSRDMLPVARGMGARFTLYKPFSTEALLSAVTQACTGAKSQ